MKFCIYIDRYSHMNLQNFTTKPSNGMKKNLQPTKTTLNRVSHNKRLGQIKLMTPNEFDNNLQKGVQNSNSKGKILVKQIGQKCIISKYIKGENSKEQVFNAVVSARIHDRICSPFGVKTPETMFNKATKDECNKIEQTINKEDLNRCARFDKGFNQLNQDSQLYSVDSEYLGNNAIQLERGLKLNVEKGSVMYKGKGLRGYMSALAAQMVLNDSDNNISNFYVIPKDGGFQVARIDINMDQCESRIDRQHVVPERNRPLDKISGFLPDMLKREEIEKWPHKLREEFLSTIKYFCNLADLSNMVHRHSDNYAVFAKPEDVTAQKTSMIQSLKEKQVFWKEYLKNVKEKLIKYIHCPLKVVQSDVVETEKVQPKKIKIRTQKVKPQKVYAYLKNKDLKLFQQVLGKYNPVKQNSPLTKAVQNFEDVLNQKKINSKLYKENVQKIRNALYQLNLHRPLFK